MLQHVLLAHFAPMRPAEMRALLDQAERYLAEIEATLLAVLEAEPSVSLRLSG